MGYHPPKSLQALLPFDHISIDLKQMPLSRRGNVYYLLVIDVATRFIFLRPLASKSTYSVAQKLLRLFCDIGFPKILQSDNGVEFINAVMKSLKSLSGIDERLISAYHHRSNGIAERAIQSTSNAVYKAVGGLISQWDDYLPSIQHAFNTRAIELHGSTPYSLLFGRKPNGFANYSETELIHESDVDRNQRLIFMNSIVFPAIFEKVKGKQQKNMEYFMKSHRMLKDDYPAGSQVMVMDEMRSAKHQPRFEGPFTVMRRKPSGNYELKGLDGTTYTRSPCVLKLVAPEILKGVIVPETIYAAVDHIVEHRTTPEGEMLYRVRWEKQGPELDSWLTAKDFIDYGPLNQYTKTLGVDKRTKSKRKTDSNTEKRKDVALSTNSLPKAKEVEVNPVNDNSPEMKNPVEIYLEKQQKNALGNYWRTTKSVKRVRNAPIVDSDSD
jgi:hypothetical protein